MSNSPGFRQRQTRSNSNSGNPVTLSDMKNLMDNMKTEVVTVLKSDLEVISSKLSHLIKRIDELEKRNTELELRCTNLEKKSNESTTFLLDEVEDRLRRKKSLVISGVPEQSKGTSESRGEADENTVESLLMELCELPETRILRCHRIGRQQDKDRLIRVVLTDEDDVKKVLRKAKLLRDLSPSYERIYINPDLTPFQREISKKLRDEVKRRHALGEEVIIRGGKIVPRIRPQNFQ